MKTNTTTTVNIAIDPPRLKLIARLAKAATAHDPLAREPSHQDVMRRAIDLGLAQLGRKFLK